MIYDLHKTQIEVAEDDHRFRVICAGRRWGKSVLARLLVLQWATKSVGTFWIVSPTYRQGKQNHWQELQKEIPRQWVAKKNEVELSITLKNGSVIELKGAENPDGLRGVKLRGLVIDEIASIRNWDWLWQEVLRPTLTDYEAPAIFISTPKGFNHFYDLYQAGQVSDGDYKSWRFTSYDNPYIPKGEIDAAKKELTEDTFYQEYMADFRKYTGLVYKDFDRQVHVIEPFDIPQEWQIYRALDFGSTNPTACLWITVDGDDNWYVYQEHYQTGQTIDYHAGVINSSTTRPVVGTYGDPSGAQWISEFSQRGIYITPANKETGQSQEGWVRFGIEKVAERLRIVPGHVVPELRGKDAESGMPSLFIFSTCTNTVREIETYRWKEKSVTQAQDLNAPEQPEKANDHCFTKNAMITTQRGELPINKVKKGDYVLTSAGYSQVLKKWNNGVKRVFKYRLQFDTQSITIEATPDHLVWTTNGWIKISQLQSGMTVCLSKNLGEKSTDSTLMSDTFRGGQNECIQKSGSHLMEQSQKDLMSTIRTRTRGIIDQITSLYSKTIHTSPTTSTKEWQSNQTSLSLSKLKEYKQVRFGMEVKKGNFGIGNTLKINGNQLVIQNIGVNSVGNLIKLGTKGSPSFAIRTARLVRLDIEESWKEKVYDLTVENLHEYFVNGLLVHNCMDALRYFAVSYQKNEPIPRNLNDFSKWKIG